MKLLLDANLAPRLSIVLQDAFPACEHVFNHGAMLADDKEIWRLAKAEGYIIVTKDADFSRMSFVFGAPPKVVWLRIGNCTTAHVERVLRTHAETIREFENAREIALLILDRP